MPRAIVDSTVPIHLRNEEKQHPQGPWPFAEWLASLRLNLMPTAVTLAEFLAGEGDQPEALKWFEANFPGFVIPVSKTVAIQAGQVQRSRPGKKLGTADALQAAIAIQRAATLLTYDHDYGGTLRLKSRGYRKRLANSDSKR